MSRLTDLIKQVKAQNPQIGADLECEFRALSSRLSFGLNFERHRPEAVELPNRPIRKGDKVRVLPPRGETKKGDPRLWKVKAIRKSKNEADLELPDSKEAETQTVTLDDLVVVAEFGDTIYPGLVPTGKVSRGEDKPWHTVINGENYHVLKALTWTHRGMVDAIYIDPPYNTGAKDWKYNNDYVEADDLYRHSKWLAMMERRLLLAKELLNPADSVLIVTIDEKEYLRLGLLLEQVFSEARIQMVTTVISPFGVASTNGLSRVEEYIYYISIGKATLGNPNSSRVLLAKDKDDEELNSNNETFWFSLMRAGTDSTRERSPNCFFPIYITENGEFHSIGDSLQKNAGIDTIVHPKGTLAIWPINEAGIEARWQMTANEARKLFEKGYARIGKYNSKIKRRSVTYLREGTIKRIEKGELIFRNGEIEVLQELANSGRTVWAFGSHNATSHGSKMLKKILPSQKFPFPKSLYAVEDSLRVFLADKQSAIILDFFSGSGTTAHAVMRLNKKDGGKRQCISVTNNEVSADEQKALREKGLRPGDPEWEKFGICDYITKPRVEAAITGNTPDGTPIKGDYKFGKTVEKEKPRSFKQIGFADTSIFDSQAKMQLVALVELPQTLVRGDCPFIVSEKHASSVLFDPQCYEDWLNALDGQEHITDFYIVTPVKKTFDMLKEQVSELLGSVIVSVEEKVPMADGFEENAEFFTLTYETPLSVSYQTAFTRIAPLLWFRAGSMGRRIDELPAKGWDVADTYGLLVDLDLATDFLKSLRQNKELRIAYIVTDDERRFQSLAQRLPEGVEAIRLYESYLTNFAFANGEDA